jgi:putative hydrolase of the HAD superfamily
MKLDRSESKVTSTPLILVFDLDDTLYPENTYVLSGMRAVAQMLSERYSLEWSSTEMSLINILTREGRGKVFDIFLQKNGMYSKKVVNECINAYRHHFPKILLYPDALDVISNFSGSKYLVTDGHKVVQKIKIDTLGIESLFEKVYITSRYGLTNCKPSLHCFRKILEREKADWSDLIYVGDNPAKDFINLNLMGAITVRVLTGRHQFDSYPLPYDSKIRIKNLTELKGIFKECYE